MFFENVRKVCNKANADRFNNGVVQVVAFAMKVIRMGVITTRISDALCVRRKCNNTQVLASREVTFASNGCMPLAAGYSRHSHTLAIRKCFEITWRACSCTGVSEW